MNLASKLQIKIKFNLANIDRFLVWLNKVQTMQPNCWNYFLTHNGVTFHLYFCWTIALCRKTGWKN